MDNTIHRRAFIKASAAVTAGLSAISANQAEARGDGALKKAVQYHMLPKNLSHVDKCRLAKKCGFEGIEINVDHNRSEKQAAELARTAKEQGLPIHSIVFGGWGTPLSHPDPAVTQKGIDGMKKCLANARAMGASTVLLVPAIVTETVGYGEAYKRSHENVSRLIDTAEQAGVIIAVENVWNKFLLSPLEFASYVDKFESPWVRAYFDIGNVILFGFSQDWIRTLNKRIVKIHLKDFKRSGYQWKNLLEGDVNWKEVRRALDETGYKGYITPELSGGDESYLKDLSGRIDKIIAM